MTVAADIKNGEKALNSRDYLGAIGHFTAALKVNPTAIQALINRASAYIRLKNYDEAKKDISAAYTSANEKGKRTEIGICYFRLANIYYLEKKYKLALSHIEKALAINANDNSYIMWKSKIELELKKNPQDEEEDEDDGLDVLPSASEVQESEVRRVSTSDVKSTSTPAPKLEEIIDKPSTNIDVINQQAPLKIKIRDDWYQSNEEVIITIFAKGIKEDALQIEFQPRSVQVSFPSAASSEYNYNLDPLYAEVDANKSHYKVYGTKLEINLVKKIAHKWPSLEGSGQGDEGIIHPGPSTSDASTTTTNTNAALTYPTSSKKAVNWSNFNIENDESEKNDNDFFTKLYKDVDDDTRRAMMKSYYQSNGTVLTTNWEEAKDKEFETSPPDGMVAKKWSV